MANGEALWLAALRPEELFCGSVHDIPPARQLLIGRALPEARILLATSVGDRGTPVAQVQIQPFA